MNSLPSVYFYEHESPSQDFVAELVEGFRAREKYISPKFFYDETGSQLFTEITRQPEYYLTRTETTLLSRHADEIGELIGGDSLLIEYGSGSSEKIRILLETLRPSIYAPLDISKDYLAQAAQALGKEYPWLEVHATCVDFTSEFSLPFESPKRRVSFFPGSSIGNFDRADAADFLGRIRKLVGQDGGLLIGVDLKKDEAILNAAYNDKNGITALFNLNVLSHLNDKYVANFNLDQFEHQARYNADGGCVQMFLVSLCKQQVNLGEETFSLDEGESIHTENSHKYSVDEFVEMARRAGFEKTQCWLDDQSLFGVFYLY